MLCEDGCLELLRERINKMSFVSVVIPCFNSAQYIEKCLIALENQKFKDFDVILVNDCSTDNTEQVILNFKKHSLLDIKYVCNNTNSGPGISRNTGINLSDSRYIAFCDSDDWYESDYLMLMAEEAMRGSKDMVFCNSQKALTNGKVIPINIITSSSNISTVSDVLSIGIDSLCSLMVKKDIIVKTPQPNLKNGEDMAIIPLMIMKSKSFGFVEKAIYNYYCHTGSLSMSASEKVVTSLEKSFEYICANKVLGYDNEIEFIGIKNVLYGAILTLFKFSFDKNRARTILLNFECKYPKWFENDNIKSLPVYKRLFLSMLRRRWFLPVKMMAKMHSLLIK